MAPARSQGVQVLQAQLACALPCTLGEGLLWDGRGQRWCWTDIAECCLHTWAGSGQPPRRHALPSRLGSLAIARSGRLLLGLDDGLAWGEWQGDALVVTPLLPVEPALPSTRINDGRTDRSGQFVFGTLDEAAPRQPIGSLYQYSLAHGLRRLALPPVCIANSICFSPDGCTLYFSDTPSGLIQQCDYNSARAEVSPPRPFALVDAPGFPDGSVVDAEGCLWNAQWGAGRVRRYASTGLLLAELRASAPHLTCPAFGGPGLATLVVTSAREGMAAEALALAPDSGSLFSTQLAGVCGLPDAMFNDDPL